MRTSSVVDVIGDSRNFSNAQFDSMYNFENTNPDGAIELKRILVGIYNKSIKERDGIRQFADLTEESFNQLTQPI